jgi:hypothetical protein
LAPASARPQALKSSLVAAQLIMAIVLSVRLIVARGFVLL